MMLAETSSVSPDDDSHSCIAPSNRQYIPKPRPQQRLTRRPFFWPACLGLVLLLFSLWSTIFATPQVWAAPAPSTILLKGAPSKPNTASSTAGAGSLTRPVSSPTPGTQKPGKPQVISHGLQHEAMQAGSVTLQVTKATRFVGSDGRLDLLIPAGAITAAQQAAAGGKIILKVTQIAPASGANDGGDLSLGTYLLQLVDAKGALLSFGLSKPLTATYHLQTNELTLGLDHPYVLLNGSVSDSTVNLSGAVAPAAGKTLTSTLGARKTQAASLSVQAHTLTVTPLISTPSTSLAWNSDSPIATFGKPDTSSVDLSSGSLSESEPINVPPGPGGLTPPVNLTYSSEAVNGQHDYASAAGWVGEGWNLSLGEITWSEHNVVAGCTPQPSCGSNWQNEWDLNDAYGTSSQLIPPNVTASTYYDSTSNTACQLSNPSVPCPILWHTANESHDKIYAYVGNVTIPSESINPVCWRVWLPNGIMEEFGCTSGSLQYFYVQGGHAEVTGWNLDMITDPAGNQIHFTYQSDMENWTDPSTNTVYSYPRDVELASIQYDSPGCLNAQTMCTGSAWAPQMQVVFNASHNPSNLTGSVPGGCNTGSNLRCDDPVSVSGGVTAPLIQNTYVLNSIQVQVRTSGSSSWNTLNSYQLSYEQSGPTTITDPPSGQSASAAGMLDLTRFQEIGSSGATALLYSGKDNSSSSSYAYMKVFDLSSQNVVVGPNTTLSYWIYPQSSTENGAISGSNSTCVAIDMIFSDGSDLRDSGAVDQNGNQLHPAHQCGHLTLDQWNYVTSDIGTVRNGKTINRIDVGYDQPANTGGYRGYIDDISITNPGSSTPLFTTDLESGSAQPTWTNTVDSSGGGNLSNVGGLCCGLTGPEMGTRQELAHDDSAALPLVTFSYTSLANYYVDSWFKPNPSTNCGPSWNTGNGGGCLLWESNSVISSGSAQSTPTGNNRFLSAISNGQGLAQSFLWSLARNNSHGVNGGGSNNADPFYCNDHQSGYPCNEADDSGWSQVVLTQQNETTERLTQSGQGGTQTTTPITQVTGYTYQLTYPLPAQECSDCVAGMYWGDQNDNDYLNYYNGVFMGFAQATVNEPDGSVNVHNYYAGQGWGIYDSSQVTCYTTAPCHNDPWWNLANAAHGDEYQELNYDANGETLNFVGTNNGNWNTVQSQSTSVALQAGTNSITFSNLASWAPNIDRIVVNGTSYEAEASANTLSGGAVVASCSACSGGDDVGLLGEGGVLEFNNISVASAGTYSMTIYYVDGDAGRAATISLSALKLLKEVDTTYTATCPPTGVSPTPPNGSITWDDQLISDLDHNNPVAVCDIDQTQQTTKTSDGSSNTATTTTNWTYDSYDRVTQQTTTTNGGTPAEVVKNTAYVWDDNITATRTSATGTYLIDTPAFTDTEDGSGNRLACSYTSYDGLSYTTGQTTSLTEGLATTETSYSNCGTSANGYTTSGPRTTTTTYNTYGDPITTDDPDANAGISGHTGCTVSSTAYTTCTGYDSTFDVFPTSSANALNQTSSTSYATTSAAFGYGIWPASTTDENSQTTSYTYDWLGRMTSETLPGETSGDVTRQWVYTNWCSGTSAQTPCEEIDEIDRLNSTTTTTTRAFYDGYGNLIETRAPGYNGQDVVTYAYYDTAGRQIFKSNPYFVTAYTGVPGAVAYSIPDSTQPGTSTNYYPNAGITSLLTTSVTDPNSHTTTTTDSVICGVPGTSDTGCYEQSMVVDANGHEHATLTGGLGKTNYTQTYTGTSGSYSLYATTTEISDAAGNLLTTISPDGSTSTASYDDLGRVTSESDPDRGVTTSTYDPNGNITESVDARGSAGTVYTGYDGLNRPLWQNSTNSATGAWVTYAYDSVASGNDGIGKLTSESFTGSGGLSGSYTYTYDNRGQQIGETITVNGTGYPIQATYNDAGQVTSETYPTGEVVTPGYSSTGWLLGLTTTISSVTTNLATNLAYTGLAGAAGRITSMNLGNSVYSYSASYDTGMRPTSASLSDTSGGTLLYQTQPTYDAANNVVGVSTTISGQTDIQQFCYDSLNRMTWAGSTGTPPCASLTPGTLTSAQYQQSDSYNVDSGFTSGPAGSYTYGNSSQPHTLTATSNGYSASYDAVGNETCRATSSATTCSGSSPTGQQLSYDPEGRLTSWQNQPTSPTATASYLYDGSGNRVAMQTTVNGTTTLTAYIGSIEEVQTAGSTTTTTTYYSVGGQRIAANVNGTFYYFGYDALGSQVVVLNSSGNLIGAQLYGPYGSSRYSTGILPTSIGFTGQQTDSVTGLDYYNARYYDPGTGLFLSADIVQGNAAGMDPYAYVGDDPETRIDPSGRMYTDRDDPAPSPREPLGPNWNPDDDSQVQALKTLFDSGDDEGIAPADLQGLTPQQIRAAVPSYATVRKMEERPGSKMDGVVFQWEEDGVFWQVEMYGPTNSGKGYKTDSQSTLHISQIESDNGVPVINPKTGMPVRSQELNEEGNWVSSSLVDPRSLTSTEEGIQSVHLTVSKDTPVTASVVDSVMVDANERGVSVADKNYSAFGKASPDVGPNDPENFDIADGGGGDGGGEGR